MIKNTENNKLPPLEIQTLGNGKKNNVHSQKSGVWEMIKENAKQ